jgi:hypothetical protein
VRGLLRQHLEEQPIAGLEALSAFARSNAPYLFYENQPGKQLVYPVTEALPAQYLRKVWAAAEWNWSEHIGEERVAATIRTLRAAIARDGLGA